MTLKNIKYTISKQGEKKKKECEPEPRVVKYLTV